MPVFTLLARYFWLLALVVTVINAVVFYHRFRDVRVHYPSHARGYHQFLIGFILVNVLLWSFMGFGISVGGVPHVFAYVQPWMGNPYVVAWHGVLITLWVIGGLWIFLFGGASFVVNHPGLLNVSVTRPVFVQIWFSVCLLGGIVAEIMMWTQRIPLPIP